MKKTIVISASLKSYRYSYKAVCLLDDNDIEVVAIGSAAGKIRTIKVLTEKIAVEGIHTVSLYLSAKRQAEYYDYIFSLNPKRIIMNPGAENDDFKKRALEKNIEVVEHCTLVMLNRGIF